MDPAENERGHQVFEILEKRPVLITAVIAITSVAVLLLNVYGLKNGVTYVFPHLFYLPIILAAYFFPRRGILFACLLSLCYCTASFVVIQETSIELASAIARSAIFIIVAAVVSILSGRMHRDARISRRLVAVVRSSVDAIIGETPEGIVTDWNAGAERLYGYTAAEMLGASILRIVPTDRQEEKHHLLRKIRGGQTSDGIETERMTKDGRRIQIFLSSSPILDSTGEIIGISEIAHDITARKEAEAALRESEEKYRVLIENAQEGIAVIQDERFIFFNDWLSTISGYSREELTGRLITEFAVDEDKEKVRTNHRLQTEGTKLKGPYVIRTRTKSGEIRWIDIKSAPITWSGRPATLNFYADITVLRRTMDELRKAEMRYRNLVENSHEIIYTIRPDGILGFVSPSWTRMLGHDPAEVTGHDFREFVHRDDIPACEEYLKKTVATRTPQPAVEYRVFSKSGSIHWHRSNIIPVFENGDAISSLVGSAVDLTEYKRAAGALELANRKLNLLSSITRHDIRNQLTALNAYIQLSQDVMENPQELREYLIKEEAIAEAIARQISFTKDYEYLGVKEAIWQNVDNLVREAAASLAMGTIRLDLRCPGFQIYADPLVVKVFYNLIDNSLHYGGEKMTTIRFLADVAEGELIITCEDDGSGIRQEDKPLLFTRGFGKHTGLGLFLSREILAITGISITENGTPGTGARFEIRVPEGTWRFKGGA